MKKLIAQAKKTRNRALAPFTHFKVGAALEAKNGKVYTGTNVECASFGSLCCAERVALFKAISEGATKFKRVAVITDTPEPSAPCGMCRQALFEFAPDMEVIMANTKGKVFSKSLRSLLPNSFTLPKKYRKKMR